MTNIYFCTSIILTLATAISYINHRFIKMPSFIAIVSGALLLSLGLNLAGKLGLQAIQIETTRLLANINFHDLLINGMLSFLLFGGALSVDLRHLYSQKWEIAALSLLSTILSTLVIGLLIYYFLPIVGLHLSFNYCLLFGALISPTDPIAVLAIFKQTKVPRDIRIMVEGESLFNDGVGIVLFLTIYQMTFSSHPMTWDAITFLFMNQTVGGILYGLLFGIIAHWLIKPVKHSTIEVLITLTIATGGYPLAQYIGVSGPLAMVAAGIVIGNYGRQFSISPPAEQNLGIFWELVEEILNAALFLLIGLELLVIPIAHNALIASCIAIPIVLVARYISVAIPITTFKYWRLHNEKAISILTWGGLRGGLAVALALSLPHSPNRNLILVMTYAIVLFAIVVQGLTIKPLLMASITPPAPPSPSLD